MSLNHARGYKYMMDLLYLDGCHPGIPRAWLAAMQRVSSPLHQQEWDRGLRSHPDQRFQKYCTSSRMSSLANPQRSTQHAFSKGAPGGDHDCKG